MLADGAYDLLDWHDHLLEAGAVPIDPYNPRNIDEPLDIEYRDKDCIENLSEDVRLKQSILEEMYNRQSQVERMIGACNDCGLGREVSRGRVHARTQCRCCLALYLRLVAAITNDDRGDNPRSTAITV